MLGKKPNPKTCEKCPHRFSERGCPCWMEGLIEFNPQTGEERVYEGCFYPVALRWLVEVVKASNRPAAAVESMRNEVCARQDAALEALGHIVSSTQLIEGPHNAKG